MHIPKKSKVCSVVDMEIYGNNTRLKYFIIKQPKESCRKSIQKLEAPFSLTFFGAKHPLCGAKNDILYEKQIISIN